MIEIVHRHIIPAAYTVLPPYLASDEATAFLLAMGWQESKYEFRAQIGGPARGFWQFERGGGTKDVILNPKTADLLLAAMRALKYRFTPTPGTLHALLEHNDVLAAVVARLYLFPVPAALPTRYQQDEAWRQYTSRWAPGKPKPRTWPEAWSTAWSMVAQCGPT